MMLDFAEISYLIWMWRTKYIAGLELFPVSPILVKGESPPWSITNSESSSLSGSKLK